MDEGRQIIKRLNKIPVINDAYNEVREIYQQTKEHNFVFRAYFSVVEYMTKSVVSATTPVIYKIFQSQFDTVNTYAVSKLNDVEEKFPIISVPTEQIIQECKLSLSHYWNYVGPVAAPVYVPAKLTITAGYMVSKTAVRLGTAAISTAMLPVMAPLLIGKHATSVLATTGCNVVCVVAQFLENSHSIIYEYADSVFIKKMKNQFDCTMDFAETLLNHHFFTQDSSDDVGMPTSRLSRIYFFATRIKQSLCSRVNVDITQFLMMVYKKQHYELMDFVSHDPIKRLVNIIRVIACGTIASGMSIISHGIRLLQVIGMTFLHTLDFFIESAILVWQWETSFVKNLVKGIRSWLLVIVDLCAFDLPLEKKMFQLDDVFMENQ